jgi:hypothetical protein
MTALPLNANLLCEGMYTVSLLKDIAPKSATKCYKFQVCVEIFNNFYVMFFAHDATHARSENVN